MIKNLSLLLFVVVCSFTALAQRATIKGVVADTSQKAKLTNSSILLIRNSDSVLVNSKRADKNGYFEFNNIQKGRYQVIVTYPKMADYIANLNLSDSSKIDLKTINMELQSMVINEVVIRAQKDAIRIKGDTISYQADSFKVAEGANVQELLKRLPGFEIGADGSIKAQGKDVTNVLVDGDEFFGDDPLLATKYLKAKSVKEIEVYDKKSKNAELTGIDDGKKEKTVNIKLKDGAKNGYIANLDANSNGDNFYDYGGMAGIFKNKLKAAVYGTNANLGLTSKVDRAMSNLKGSDYDIIEVGDDGSVMMMSYVGMGDDDYFNPQNGLPNNKVLGAHLSNKWDNNKKGFKLNYKYGDRNTDNHTTSNLQQLLPNGTTFISSGNANRHAQNLSNDVKANVEIAVDSSSTLKFSVGLKNTRGNFTSTGVDETHNINGLNVSQNFQSSTGLSTSDQYNGNINFTKKFKRKGRTLSIDLQPDVKKNTTDQNTLNKTSYYDVTGNLDRTDNLDLFKDDSGSQNSIASKISYSEPIGKKFILQTSYSFKNVYSESYKQTFDKNVPLGSQMKLIDSLSNNFKFNSTSHVGRGVIQFRHNNFSINTGIEGTGTNLSLNDLDRNNQFDRNYLNLAPSANITYKIARNTGVSLSYNGRTAQPSLNQLQPIREINNPLYQVVGNPNLRPSFTNNFGIDFNSYVPKTQQSLFGYISFNEVNNQIVSTEIIDQNNKRTVSYVNINGNKNYGGYLSYYKGFAKLHMNLNLSLSYNRGEQSTFINSVLNKSINNNWSISSGISYYTEKLNFSYRPRLTLTSGTSTVGVLFTGNTVMHTHDISSTLQLPYNAEFSTNVSLNYRPADAAFAQDLNTAQWNASFGVKALKDKSLLIKLSVNDILNEKIGYNRYVGGNTISESTYSYIPRYFLLGINYNFSGNFGTKEK